MFRKDLIDLLNTPMSVAEIARQVREPPRDVEDDLKHLIKSLKHTERSLVVTPAQCRKCGFEFGPDKLRKPSKCPECHSTWLTEPRLQIGQKAG